MLNIILLTIAEIFGDFKLKSFARYNNNSDLFGGVVGYTGVIFFLIKSLKQNNILYVNGIWDGMSAIIESLAAYYILGERLNNNKQYFGLVFIIIGIILFNIGKAPY
jgi:multidrug transporter EmrE-like cation transporter